MQLGRYRDAMDDYSQAINLYPDFANAYLNRSYVKSQMGQFNSAKTDYQIAQKKIAEYKSKMADSTKALQFADTTKKYDRLLALDADFAKKDFNNDLLQHKDVDIRLKPLFKFRLDEKRKEKLAIDHQYEDKSTIEFTNAVKVPVVLTTQPGSLLANSSQLKEEVEARLKNEKNSLDYFAKALLESGNKQFNSALDSYNKAIEAEPSQTFYYLNRGALQSEMIDFISSIESNVQVLTLDNAGATRAKVQEQATRTYDYSPAIHDMLKAAGLAPKFPFIYYNLGNLYCLSNDLPEAIKQYSKALELFPSLAEAYYNRGLVLIYLKDKDKGCLDLSKAGELGVTEAYGVIKKYCVENKE
jgi:tetratricopeptide (TPR) repeat protein